MSRDPEHAYRTLDVDVAAHAAEAWSDALLAAGAMSIDGGDSGAATGKETELFAEGVPERRVWWPVSRLVALFGPDVDPERAIATAAGALGCKVPAHRIGEIADRDWVAATRDQFGPIEAAPGLWVVPTWCEPVAPDAINIRLDPGLAFGTGSHPTTQMCLAWLMRVVRAGDSVLDYGCGSGILALAAAKLGAIRVRGVDVDPQAVRSSRDNARANGVRARFAQPPRTSREPRYDVVIANILANPLRELAPTLAGRCRAGGRIALAGVLAAQAEAVIGAYRRWFTIRGEASRDGWVLLAGERRRRVS